MYVAVDSNFFYSFILCSIQTEESSRHPGGLRDGRGQDYAEGQREEHEHKEAVQIDLSYVLYVQIEDHRRRILKIIFSCISELKIVESSWPP